MSVGIVKGLARFEWPAGGGTVNGFDDGGNLKYDAGNVVGLTERCVEEV